LELKQLAVVVIICGGVAGCRSGAERQPAIGVGTDDYKASPCACFEVEQNWSDDALAELLERV